MIVVTAKRSWTNGVQVLDNAPNKMADEKQNGKYKYIHYLTYEQNLKLMPYTLERVKMA